MQNRNINYMGRGGLVRLPLQFYEILFQQLHITHLEKVT